MEIGELIREDLVWTGLKARSRSALFREMVERLVARGCLAEPQSVIDLLMTRERIRSTGIKAGFAIPHAYVSQIENSLIAVGLSRRGIDFKAPDGEPVHVVFLLLDSPKHKDQHLRLMAQLSCLLDRANLTDDLLAAETPAAALEVLFRKSA